MDNINARFKNLEAKANKQEMRMDQFESLLNSWRDCYEPRMISSIPDNLVSRLEELLMKKDEDSKAEKALLEEKATIESNSELMEYYIAVQTNLNGIFLACGAISSGMVANDESGVAGKASWIIDKLEKYLSGFVPGLSVAFDVISMSLSAYDDSIQKPKVDRVARVCMNDPVLISKVTEIVARKLALFLKDIPQPVDSKLPGRSIRERTQYYLDRCRSSEVKSRSKDQALKDVKAIIAAIMDGTLTVEGGGDANTTAEAIVDLLRKLSRFRSR